MTTATGSSEVAEPESLYGALATAAPASSIVSQETSLTATKETLDNDTEDVSDDTLDL